jgi:hypothetical protein
MLPYASKKAGKLHVSDPVSYCVLANPIKFFTITGNRHLDLRVLRF